MKAIRLKFFFLLFTFCLYGYAQTDFLLVFSKTEGYRHESIADGIKALRQLGEQHDFEITVTEDAAYFQKDSLELFDAVLFLNTTGNVFNKEQEVSFKEFIHNGGGFIGVHSATDTEYDWKWYGKLVGAYFLSHPAQQEATLQVVDTTHAATRSLPKQWDYFDEWYNLKEISDQIHVLVTIDENSYQGGENGSFHPISWYQEFEGCKMFYTSLGHRKEDYTNVLFLAHLQGGINYVLDNED